MDVTGEWKVLEDGRLGVCGSIGGLGAGRCIFDGDNWLGGCWLGKASRNCRGSLYLRKGYRPWDVGCREIVLEREADG
jgi:hypothetical protein